MPAVLEGIIISNMMPSIAAYNEYAQQVLMPSMDSMAPAQIRAFEASGDTDNPLYEGLLMG